MIYFVYFLWLMVIYCLYQLVRNEAVFNIRSKWINYDDLRWHYYSYDEMFKPNISNWFGLRFPRDKHFK